MSRAKCKSYRALKASSLNTSEMLKADVILANGEAVAAVCVELGADPAIVVTLREPVDRAVFHPEGGTLDLEGTPRIVTPAGPGLAAALEACAQAAVRRNGLRVVVIGSAVEELPRFASNAPGFDDATTAKCMRWADALLVTSSEDAGWIPRAFACGTPCIARDEVEIREIATDAWDSLLTAPAAVKFADAVARIADPGLQARLAAPARTSSEPFDATYLEQRHSGILDYMTRPELPKVSVVLPTFNRAELVEAAIRSVLEQDYPNLELIVVNDGSTDTTRDVLDRIDDPRVRIIHQDNRKLPGALNTGFRQATGEYWTWTSDDNRYRPGAIRAMVRELELDQSAGLVYAGMQVTNEAGQTRPAVSGPPEAITEGCIIGGCFLYRAEIARRTGEYDESMFLVEDYDYWLRMRHHTRFIRLLRVLYDYGNMPGSLSRTRLTEQAEKRIILLERELGNEPDWPERKYFQYCVYSSIAKSSGDCLKAVRAALCTVRLKPLRFAAWWTLLRALTPLPLLKLTRRIRGLNVE